MVQETGPGRLLAGRYRIGHQRGSGGYGSVWAAYDEVLDVEVAVEKVGAADPAGTARAALRAHHMLAAVRHPHVVPVHDVLEADGQVWAVMPLVAGPSLAAHLAERGRMPAEQVRQVAHALLDGLEALHDAGLVHGDVRPGTVHLHQDRWALLPSVGMLAPATGDTETTRDHHDLAGAADYLAPELLRGVRKTPGSDLYALGATLYHLLAGHAPFHRDDVWTTLTAVAHQQPPALRPAGALGPLIEALLDKDPATRPTAARARRMLDAAGEQPHDVLAAGTARTAPAAPRRALAPGSGVMTGGAVLLVFLVAALSATRAHADAGDVAYLFVALLPWALFALGLCFLALQVRTALARRRGGERAGVWRWYVRSLAPPAPWTAAERDRRQAAAERAVDEALAALDGRLAAASPGRTRNEGRGPADV